jgi:hypothetical protein
VTLLHHVDFGDGSLAIHERAIRVGGETTDQIRTTAAKLSAHQRSTMNTKR